MSTIGTFAINAVNVMNQEVSVQFELKDGTTGIVYNSEKFETLKSFVDRVWKAGVKYHLTITKCGSGAVEGEKLSNMFASVEFCGFESQIEPKYELFGVVVKFNNCSYCPMIAVKKNWVKVLECENCSFEGQLLFEQFEIKSNVMSGVRGLYKIDHPTITFVGSSFNNVVFASNFELPRVKITGCKFDGVSFDSLVGEKKLFSLDVSESEVPEVVPKMKVRELTWKHQIVQSGDVSDVEFYRNAREIMVDLKVIIGEVNGIGASQRIKQIDSILN